MILEWMLTEVGCEDADCIHVLLRRGDQWRFFVNT